MLIFSCNKDLAARKRVAILEVFTVQIWILAAHKGVMMVVMYSWQNGREGRNGGSGYHLALSASSFDNTSITSFSLNEGSSDVNSATPGASSSSETPCWFLRHCVCYHTPDDTS